jgi:hypothetical protein
MVMATSLVMEQMDNFYFCKLNGNHTMFQYFKTFNLRFKPILKKLIFLL